MTDGSWAGFGGGGESGQDSKKGTNQRRATAGDRMKVSRSATSVGNGAKGLVCGRKKLSMVNKGS